MSVPSTPTTRSGRMVKIKHKFDAEDLIGPQMKAATSINKGKSPKTVSLEDKSIKSKAFHKNHQDTKKQELLKETSLSSSPGKSIHAKPGIQVISEADDDCKIKVEDTDIALKEDNIKEALLSPLTVRRSSRAPVPSSKYKDMELDVSRSKKRSYSAGEVSEAEPEQVKKKRKTSSKSSTQMDNHQNTSLDVKNMDESFEVDSSLIPEDVNAAAVVEDDHINLVEADPKKENKAVTLEKQVENVIEQPSVEECSRATPILEKEQSAVEECSRATPFLKKEKPTVEECSSAALVHETEVNLNIAEEKPPDFPSIKISGQQLTFTKRDGETVAVVTIPASSIKDETPHESLTFHGTLVEAVDDEKEKKTFTELVTVNPTIHNLGHVVKKDFVEEPFATVVDGTTYLNLSVEATKMSSILKGKHAAPPAKPDNPLKGHGRVLRNPVGSIIMKTRLVPPRNFHEVSEASVAYSLLRTTKQQGDEPISFSTNVPVSVKTSQENQSPQVIVIRRHPQQKTVINFSHDLSADYITAPTEPAVDSAPKCASEILLQRIKMQAKQENVTESSHAIEILVQKPSSVVNDDDALCVSTDACRIVDDTQPSQMIVPESVDILPVLRDGCDKVTEESPDGLLLHTENNTKTESPILESRGNEEMHCQSSEVLSVSQTSAHELPKSIDISEKDVKDNTILPAVTVSALADSNNADKEETETTVSSINIPISAKTVGLEQNAVTKIIDTGGEVSTVTLSSGNKEKEKFLEKITVVDNGHEYVRIVTEEEVAEEIISDVASEILQQTGESAPEMKPDVKEEPEDAKVVEKQTSGTQTVYSPKVQNTTVVVAETPTTTTTHTLTTVVDVGSEKKQVYYVSVIPNKGIMAKTKTSMYSSAASWVIGENGMYCCEKCDYQTDRKANFYKHRRSHTGAKPHVCSVCQYKAGTSSNLKRHMGIHKDIREHKCEVCGLCFRQKIHLERHVKYKHEEKSIKCPMCDYICANEQPDLKMHIKRKHSIESSGEMLTCSECNAMVGNRKDLKQHMKFHKDGPELKLFCKECSFVTDCQSRLKRHTAIHSKMKPFQCGVCSYRAAQKEHVLRHLRTQHKIDIKRDGKRPWRRHRKSGSEDGSKERADFTSGDKIFACNHCTMRFAKLINLYKHLHTQHGDIMPAESTGSFYCVVCEFSTTNKKNLLVHMRRHNMTDQTPPTHVYSCVLCRYVNPRRRNLFQHMRKKHNINVCQQAENEADEEGEGREMEVSEIIGSVNKALTSSNAVPLMSAEMTESSSQEIANDLTDVATVIKIEDLTQVESASVESDEIQALVIDSRAADVTEVVHTTHAVEALEGLQALAEQAGLIDNIIEEQVPVLDEQHTIVIEQNGSSTELVVPLENVGGELQHFIQAADTMTGSGDEATERLELSEDQLSNLRNGDMVEMEGNLYLVELTQDPENSNKQLLSFLPVTSATIAQDSHS